MRLHERRRGGPGAPRGGPACRLLGAAAAWASLCGLRIRAGRRRRRPLGGLADVVGAAETVLMPRISARGARPSSAHAPAARPAAPRRPCRSLRRAAVRDMATDRKRSANRGSGPHPFAGAAGTSSRSRLDAYRPTPAGTHTDPTGALERVDALAWLSLPMSPRDCGSSSERFAPVGHRWTALGRSSFRGWSPTRSDGAGRPSHGSPPRESAGRAWRPQAAEYH